MVSDVSRIACESKLVRLFRDAPFVWFIPGAKIVFNFVKYNPFILLIYSLL